MTLKLQVMTSFLYSLKMFTGVYGYYLINYCFTTLSILTCFITLAPVQNLGQFKVHSGGLAWKRQGGGKTIEIDKADLTSVTWMKVPRAYQLGVKIKDGLSYTLIGFREQVMNFFIILSLFL